MENTVHSITIRGEVASSGIARGSAFICACAEHEAAPRRRIREEEIPAEMEKFDAAVEKAHAVLVDLQKRLNQSVGAREAAIFEAHIALLHDPLLREEISVICREKALNVESALEEAVDKIGDSFARMQDPCFRERAADVRDIGKRLGDILRHGESPEAASFPPGSIIITHEVLPSILGELDRKRIRALVVEEGGQTAHATILARAAGIPLLIHVSGATRKIQMKDQVLVDGISGKIFVNPSPEILHEYGKVEADLRARHTALEGLRNLPALTRDGVLIKLYANIGKTADAELAARINAEGAGLYRTEFVFLQHDHFPSEEEQYEIYRSTVGRLKTREAAIRLLDIGSDKILPYLPLPAEANPSLGQRGMRLLLAHPEILHVQLRAILRVSAEYPVSILFPMVNGIEDLRAAKRAIEKAKADLVREGRPFDSAIRLGAMIETPSAAIMTGRLAAEVDYFSIGTNDLVQYLLTSDRTSSAMAFYYEPLHPAVLQMLASIAVKARTGGKAVSICGEMAGNPVYTQLLLGLGFRNFSVSPGELLEIKNIIRSTDLRSAELLATQMLQAPTVREVKNCLELLGRNRTS